MEGFCTKMLKSLPSILSALFTGMHINQVTKKPYGYLHYNAAFFKQWQLLRPGQ